MANRAVSTVRDTSVRVPLYRVVHSGTGLGLAAAGALAAALMLFGVAAWLNMTPRTSEQRIVERWIRENSPGDTITFQDMASRRLPRTQQEIYRKMGMPLGGAEVMCVRVRFRTSGQTTPQLGGGSIIQTPLAYQQGVYARQQDNVYLVQSGRVVWACRNAQGDNFAK